MTLTKEEKKILHFIHDVTQGNGECGVERDLLEIDGQKLERPKAKEMVKKLDTLGYCKFPMEQAYQRIGLTFKGREYINESKAPFYKKKWALYILDKIVVAIIVGVSVYVITKLI